MKTFKQIIAVIALLCVWGTESTAGTDRPWLLSLNANHGSFSTNDIDNSGTQTITYAQLAYDSDNWGVAVTGSYSNTSYTTERAEGDFNVSTLTDTAISTYYVRKIGGISLRAGIDAGIPTGKSSFSSQELTRFIGDEIYEDLTLVNSYGAGFSVRPHAQLTYEAGEVTWGLGVKYENHGSYDTTTDLEDDKFDPGDSVTAVVSAITKVFDEDFLMLSLAYTTFGKDRFNDQDVFRNGDIRSLEARYIRQWSEKTRSNIGIDINQGDANEAVVTGDILQSQTGNSNGNQIEVFFDTAYEFSQRYTFTGVIGYKNVAANGFPEGDDLHDAGRSVAYLEPGVVISLKENVYCSAKLRYANIKDKKDSFSSQDASYSVINADLGVVFTF